MRGRSPSLAARAPRVAVAIAIGGIVAAAPIVAPSAERPEPRPRTESPQADTARVDDLFAEWDRPDSPGCALGVIRDGEFVLERGYGMANLDYDVPITTETVFYTGSVSKQFTAAAIALLALEGRLSLDDDIRTFLPEMAEYDEPIRVRHLVHHTSGLRDIYTLMALAGLRLEDVFSDEEAIALIARQRALNFAPGTEYLYSNSGYFLMSQIVERVTGTPLREFTRARIFEPLGMDETHFHDRPWHVLKNRAVSYQPDAELGFRISYLGNFDKVGAGGLYSTVRDFLHWERNFESGDVGGAELLSLIQTRGRLRDDEPHDYAFGLQISSYRGLATVGHSGSMMGFKAAYLRFPDQRFATVVLCNLGPIDPMSLARAVADVYLADDLQASTDEAEAEQAAQPGGDATPAPGRVELSELAGRYTSDELGVAYELLERDGTLVALIPNTEPFVLDAVGDDEFRGRGWRLRFHRDPAGAVAGFSVDAGRVTDIRFVRSGR